MRLRKQLVWIIIIMMAALSAAVVSGQRGIPDGADGKSYYVAFPVSITVDGSLSDWDRLPRQTVKSGPLVPTDPNSKVTLKFALASDADNLYLLLEANDPNIVANLQGAAKDSIEIYINATGQPYLKSFEPGVVQLVFGAANIGRPVSGTVIVGTNSEQIPVQAIVVPTATGYAVEASIPLRTAVWSIVPVQDKRVGFQVQLNSAGGQGRDTKLSWSIADQSGDNSHLDPSVWGELIFWQIGDFQPPSTPVDQPPIIIPTQDPAIPTNPVIILPTQDPAIPTNPVIILPTQEGGVPTQPVIVLPMPTQVAVVPTMMGHNPPPVVMTSTPGVGPIIIPPPMDMTPTPLIVMPSVTNTALPATATDIPTITPVLPTATDMPTNTATSGAVEPSLTPTTELPTATATETAVVTAEATAIVTAETTLEATVEPTAALTAEATGEPTAEATQDGPKSNNFSVDGSTIYDPQGNVFIAKGVNINGYNWVWERSSVADVDLIDVCWKFNLVRVNNFLFTGRIQYPQMTDNNNLDAIVNTYTSRGIVVVIEAHDFIGSYYQGDDLETMVNWFVDLATKYRDNPYVWFDIMNEPGGRNGIDVDNWINMHGRVIDAIRNQAHANNIIIVEGAYGGQDNPNANDQPVTDSAILKYSGDVLSYNGQNFDNIVFSIHTYDLWNQGDAKLANFIDQANAKGIPLIIGEYGIVTDQDTLAAAQTTFNVTQAKGIGRVVWHWDGHDWNDLTVPGGGWLINDCQAPSNLSWFGQQVWNDNHTP